MCNDMQEYAKKTDTKSDTKKGTKGIRFVCDPNHSKSPWMLTVFVGGKKKRSFWPTKTAAIKEKRRVEKVSVRDGATAHDYDRAAHAEYCAAKKIAGNVSLVDVARFYAQRVDNAKAGEETPKVNAAIEKLLETKETIKRSETHRRDLKARLGNFARTFGDRMLSGVSRNEIVDWLLGLKVATRSVRNSFNAVRNLFRYSERRGWIEVNPCRRIDPKTDLPPVIKAPVGVLSVAQGHALLHAIERERPRFLHFYLVQYFAGVRNEEARRFRGAWVDAKQKLLIIPGWILDGDSEPKPGSKTRDDWVIDGIAGEFWAWLDAYPAPAVFNSPTSRSWARIKRLWARAEGDGKITKWPHNALRHSFATYDLSAHRDQNRTSLMLRHQSPRKLWSNYLAKLVPSAEGEKYFAVTPLIE
jgi:site-specific recombinase XerD